MRLENWFEFLMIISGLFLIGIESMGIYVLIIGCVLLVKNG